MEQTWNHTLSHFRGEGEEGREMSSPATTPERNHGRKYLIYPHITTPAMCRGRNIAELSQQSCDIAEILELQIPHT